MAVAADQQRPGVGVERPSAAGTRARRAAGCGGCRRAPGPAPPSRAWGRSSLRWVGVNHAARECSTKPAWVPDRSRSSQRCSCVLAHCASAAQSQSGGVGRTRLVDDACAPTLADRAVSVFARGSYTGVNHEVQGRVIALGDALRQGDAGGTALAPNPDRDDLIAGGSLQADGAQTPNGSATYGTSFDGQLIAPIGTVTRACRACRPRRRPTPTDAELSAAWTQLTANGSIEGPTYGQLQLVGGDAERNVFRISADRPAAGAADPDQSPGRLDDADRRHRRRATARRRCRASASSCGTARRTSRSGPSRAPTSTASARRPGVELRRREIAPDRAGDRLAGLDPRAAGRRDDCPARRRSTARSLAANVDDQATLFLRPFDGCLPPLEPEPADGPRRCWRAASTPSPTASSCCCATAAAPTSTSAWDDELSAQHGAFTADRAPRHLVRGRGRRPAARDRSSMPAERRCASRDAHRRLRRRC